MRIRLVTRRIHPLSPNQYRCLMLAGQGYTYDEIQAETGMAYHTVKNHLHMARKKLGVHQTGRAYTELMRMIRRNTK